MKNKLRLLIASALTFVLACLTAAPAAAADYDFEVDGLYYNVVSTSDLTCSVTYGDSKYTGDVVIPEEVTYGNRTFSVTQIGGSAFQYCTSLTSVTIPNSVTEIGGNAFEGCANLTSVTIGNSVTVMASYAFSGCTSLASITIPNSVTYIGTGTFYECTGLTSVTIEDGPSTLTLNYSYDEVGFYEDRVYGTVLLHDYLGTFASCPLKSVYVGRNLDYKVTSPRYRWDIYYSPFSYQGLTKLTIGSSVTTIGEYAFFECRKLENIICLAKTPPAVTRDCFQNYEYDFNYNATLYVPVGTSSAYASDEVWKNFLIKEGVPNAIKDITVDPNGESTIFNLQGQRLAQPQKGINIINGKKVLVK